MRKIAIPCFVIIVFILTACGSDNDSLTNRAPVSVAGEDQNVTTGTLVTLDGSGSTDPDGDQITYSWSFISAPVGSSANLSDETAVKPEFTADLDGLYEFGLVVNDGELDSVEDLVAITATAANSAPVADAGIDQNVTTGTLVTLDGSGSSDANGDTLTYLWSIASAPTGSTATLSDETSTAPTFTPDFDGRYEISLVVNDGSIDSSVDNLIVTAATANSAPVADGGSDQNVSVNDTVILDGSGSSDADGDSLTYLWSITSKPVGSTVTLSNDTAEKPTFIVDVFGDYVFSLTVNDGQVDSQAVTVTISTQFAPPAGYVAVNFTIDDTANKTYDNTDGLAWKGSFGFNSATRILTQDGSWGGPFPMLYDDGPWTSGGHEPEGATAGDSLWGVTVWVSNAIATTLEYGAISGSVDGSDGTWIWESSTGNGAVSIPVGATTAINAPGLIIPVHGTIDLLLTIDVSSNGANLASGFQTAYSAGDVQVKVSALGWNTSTLFDDGTHQDETANDGIYSFALSEFLGKHDGLPKAGDVVGFVFVLKGVEYKVSGTASSAGVSAYTADGSAGWTVSAIGVDAFGLYITAP